MKNEPKIIYLNCCDDNHEDVELPVNDFKELDTEYVTWSENRPIFDSDIKFYNESEVKPLIDILTEFINSTYVGCTKKELDKIRKTAEKVLENMNLVNPKS